MNVATDRDVLADDLSVIGLTLLATTDDCGCGTCLALDMQFGVDALAVTDEGYTRCIAHRYQPTVAYDTITIRAISDRGYDKSEAYKIQRGLSMADIVIQSYPNHFMWAMSSSIRNAYADRVNGLRRCRHHPQLKGSGGQTFDVFCPLCCSMRKEQR